MAFSSPAKRNGSSESFKEDEPANPGSDGHPRIANNKEGAPAILCDGQWLPNHFVPSVKFAQQHFLARPSDIFLCSFPKSGTTWLKALMFCVATRRDYPQLANHPLLSANPHSCVKFLEEACHGEEGVEASNGTSFRLLASHTAYWVLPESIRSSSSSCRIVYVCREPKDTLVSFWKFVMGILGKPIGEGEFIEPYLNGMGAYGPLWDHVLGYWNESLKHPEKVMFLKYEEIKSDQRGSLIRLAKFMGCPFSQEEEDDGLVEKIVDLCSFQSMRKLEVNKSGMSKICTHDVFSNKLFLRRGETGDWQNHLTPEMAKRIDDMTARKFGGSGLFFGDEHSPK